ncbi:MFS transporter [Corynebacterium sp. H78]|uniref:MFS transporter n=1 Tax=Corynebacterium sp. H78 TaxID=3133417 RepID=UPI00309915E3
MKRWFAMLVAVTLLSQAVFNGGRVLLSWRVLAMGGDAALIGWFTAAFSLVPLLIAVPAGRFVDAGRAPAIMRAGLIVTVFAPAGMALSSHFALLFLSYVALGFAHMTTLIAGQGMASKLRGSSSGLDSLFAYLTLGISVGQLIGISFAGAIASMAAESDITGATDPATTTSVNTTPALWWLTGLAAIALAAGWFNASAFRRFDLTTSSHKTGTETSRSTGTFEMLRLPGMPSAMTASIAVIVAIDLLTAYMPVLGHELGIPVAEVTIILAARSAMAVVSRALMPLVLRHTNRNLVLIVTTSVGAVPLLAMPFATTSIQLTLLSGVCGLAWGFVMPMTMTWISQLVDDRDRALALSVRLMGNRLAQVLVPPVAGIIATSTGVGSVFLVSGLLSAASAVGTVRELGMKGRN